MALDKKEKNKKRNDIIGYIVGMIALILCIYIVSSVIVANNEHRPPRIFGLSVSYVPTESMEPVIETNSYVLFGQTSYDSCNLDDIIVYYNSSEQKYIIHRVVGKVVNGVLEKSATYYNSETINLVHADGETNYLVTMGDNNGNRTDTVAVTSNMVYGKYIIGLGFMNIFSGGIDKNLIFFILIGIFVIMIGMQTASAVIKKKTDDAKKQNEESREQMLEELKKEILAEELAKIKAQNEAKQAPTDSTEKASEAAPIEEIKPEETPADKTTSEMNEEIKPEELNDDSKDEEKA